MKSLLKQIKNSALGFSLLEIMLSLGIMTVIATGALGYAHTSNGLNQDSRLRLVAMQVLEVALIGYQQKTKAELTKVYPVGNARAGELVIANGFQPEVPILELKKTEIVGGVSTKVDAKVKAYLSSVGGNPANRRIDLSVEWTGSKGQNQSQFITGMAYKE